MINLTHHNKGFTLIEMLVSLALYTIVAVIAVGTLLVLIGGNSQSTGDQAVVTSLSYALDSMTRDIRTGTQYYCGTAAQATSSAILNSTTTVRNCSTPSAGFSFRESGTSTTNGKSNNRIAYYYLANQLWRQVGANPAEAMLGDDIKVTAVNFFTSGASPLHISPFGEIYQPTVTIIIDAIAVSTSNPRPFTIQTTITQRELDI